MHTDVYQSQSPQLVGRYRHNDTHVWHLLNPSSVTLIAPTLGERASQNVTLIALLGPHALHLANERTTFMALCV